MTRVAISDDFLEAYAEIPRFLQKKVRNFVTKFKQDPTSHSIKYESIHDMRDERVRTVRIDKAYRAIVLHPSKGDVYTLLWVDNHDEAMAWARHKEFSINPRTGAMQVLDTEAITQVTAEIQREQTAEPETKPLQEYALFETFADDELLRTGVPQILLPAVRALKTADALEKLEPHLPAEAYEALFWIANLGHSVDQAINEVTTAKLEAEVVDTEDIETALQHPDSQRRFKIIETEDELEAMLDAPLEKWRVFLHPSQADLVEKEFNGPARVLGGAGTGKTVVAMHRARYLAREVFTQPSDRILFFTFTSTLAHNVQQNLRNLCGAEVARIEVVHLHKWAVGYLRQQRIRVDVLAGQALQDLWRQTLTAVGGAEFEAAFYQAEWENVVKANRITERGDYLRVPRRGQGSRLSRLQRTAVWDVFKKFRQSLTDMGKIEWNDVPALARQQLEQQSHNPLPYRAIIVDEVQDLFPEELRLVRAIVPEGPNDIFMVGDAHQRIHSTVPVVMSRCGLEIRGRARKLKINYRTTEMIRRWSLGVLEGITIDDLDGQTDEHRLYTSLRKGVAPTVKNFASLAEERQFVIEQIERLVVMENVKPQFICIVMRESRMNKNYTRGLEQAGIPYLSLRRDTPDDASEGVRLATMHRVKGLEFTHIFIVGANAGVLPSKYIVAEDEEALRERCLLHVAATRARDTLTITSYGQPSPFITSLA